MRGFDAEFRDLPHYITAITDRIWENRRIDDIHRYYSDPCVVETPSSVSTSLEDVVRGTESTLVAFPDRRLLAEDIIWSGDDTNGFMSSHRIISTMTHRGDGAFGAPSNNRIHVRTIADCWCIENRISHEWLVRDQAAIAKAIGVSPRVLATRWLTASNGTFAKSSAPPAPTPFAPHIAHSPNASRWANAYAQLWQGDVDAAISGSTDEAITAITPSETTRYGRKELSEFWRDYRSALTCKTFAIEHLIERNDPGRNSRLAMRWRARCAHTGGGMLGSASGKPVEVLGISHAEIVAGSVVREWILIDEIALWMQVLSGTCNDARLT